MRRSRNETGAVCSRSRFQKNGRRPDRGDKQCRRAEIEQRPARDAEEKAEEEREVGRQPDAADLVEDEVRQEDGFSILRENRR